MQLHSKAKWDEPQEHMKVDVSTSETNLEDGVDEEAERNLAQLCCLFLILSQGAQPEETRRCNLFRETRSVAIVECLAFRMF